MARVSRVKRLVTIGATFASALSIGFVMQYADADAARYAEGPLKLPPVVKAQGVDASPLARATVFVPKIEAPDVQQEDGNEILRLEPGTVKLTALVSEAAQLDTPPSINLSGLGEAPEIAQCPVNVIAVPEVDATVRLIVQSICRPSASFDVHHNGVVFSERTDDMGRAVLKMPALAVDASVFVSFTDGGNAAATTSVPDAANYKRVVLQWEDLPAEIARIARDEGETVGHLDRLGAHTGEAPSFAEIYSFPASLDLAEGLQDLSVRLDVTPDNCARNLIAQSFHVYPGADLRMKDIRITLPDCEQVGTFLELKKVMGAQTLAAR